jgi:NodT family efflux transporter outer membrane factor (OMF) lipoprotein
MRRGLLLAVFALSACMVGPDYRKPDPILSSEYKELQGWTIAQPQDAADRGAWWSVYHDPVLDALERQVEVSNQTVKQFEAQYRNAVALVQGAQANLFPVVGVDANVTRRSGFGGSGSTGSNFLNSTGIATNTTGNGTSGGGGSSGAPRTQYSLEGTADWTLDVWGAIRRQVESQVAGAQVGAADIANAKLSAQATLATDYFDLRAEDSLEVILRNTVAAFEHALQIVQNQHNAGTVSAADMVTAQAQLEGARAQLVGVGVQRAQFEHAIAVLTGHPPAELTIPPAQLTLNVPVMPPGLPSTLLQRRPDIAAAERQVQQENELIGVQVAAYYPTISFSTLAGYVGSPLSQLFTTANRIWSLGASADQTLFAGGARSSAVAAAQATYDQSVANYRQVVLTALQQVEDQLSTLRILERQARAEAVAVAAAQRAVDVTLNQYRAGTVAYTAVITEQTSLLSNQQAQLAVQQNRLVASVALITALGGGWNKGELPSRDDLPHALDVLKP